MFRISSFTFRNKGGFTLIEMLVVVAITAILSSYVVIYSKTSQHQIALYVEEQKIAGVIFRAKSLAIAAYNVGTTNCGYGVKINYNNGTYDIFSYPPPPGSPAPPSNTTCDTVNDIILGNVKPMVSAALNPDLMLQSSGKTDALQYVLFVSPAPTTVISVSQSGAKSANSGKIYLQTKDGSASATITVSPYGQVDF